MLSLNKNSLSIFIVLTISLSCASQINIDKKQPNIIVIMTDDQGWGDLSMNGNSNLSTPNIDAMGAESALFEHFYVCPVCSPTRAELLTGRYHQRGGVYSTSAGGERLDLDETTIAEIFKEAGYHTAAYGKWHNGMQHPYHPNARGFDDFYGFCSGHWGHYYSPMLEHNGQITKGNGFLIDDFTEHGLQFIDDHTDEPFFLYLPFNTPHSPMQVPDRWWDKFADHELPLRYHGEEEENIQHTRAALAMCENIDWNVGRILDKVDELGLAEETIILYLSDNGPNGWRWNGGMRGRKGSTDEGGVRSPLMVRWPGKIEPGEITQLSGAIDLLPTLADLANVSIESNEELDGISLADVLLGNPKNPDERIIINHWKGKTSLRTKQYRLDHLGRLYDMIADPGQKNELSNQPSLREGLIAAQTAFEQEVVAELPRKDTRAFTAGHPDFAWTQLPARDAKASGEIKRSNRYPNDSYFLNWISADDSIYWDVEMLSSGVFEAIIYYTIPGESIGCEITITNGLAAASKIISEAHDPKEIGASEDRDLRQESYVKDFKEFSLGTLALQEGQQRIRLLASDLKGQAIDFRLLMLKRIN